MKNSKLFGGILLISGTTIGAAMLALPISTGMIGFFPAVLTFLVCWLLMLWAAFLFLEVNLCLPGQINLITMAEATLGKIGSTISWVGYIALLYSLIAAYMTGSGPLLIDLFEKVLGFTLPTWFTPFPILILFAPCVYFGVKFVDYVNRYLMIGLVLSYVVMVSLLLNHLDFNLLLHVDLKHLFFVFPVVFVSFGYHIIIPSLTTYLDRDVKKIKQCILIGSFLPIIIYLLWELLILGTIPVYGHNGIATMIKNNTAPSQVLSVILESSFIAVAIRIFSLFAIITSFIGVSQSTVDFLKDGLKTGNNFFSRVGVIILTFVPPLLFVILFQKGFVTVLEYAGVIIAVIIGIMPIAMVWSARYIKNYTSTFKAVGGKVSFIIGILFYIGTIALLIANQLGYVTINLEQYL